MKFLEILEKVEQIRKLSRVTPAGNKQQLPPEMQKEKEEKALNSQKKALDEWKGLLASVHNEHGNVYEDYLKKFAVGYGLAHVMENPPALDEPPPGSNALYQQILPLCELAYLEENNGDAKEHATKIATIFNDEQTVVDWLLQYSKKLSELDSLVHDACLFDLPPLEECTFSLWKKWANENGNMGKPSFRTMLRNAPAIEALVASEARAKPKNSPKIDSKTMQEAEKEVKVAIANYRRKKRESSDNLSPKEKEERTEALKALAVKKLDAQLTLAKVSRGIPLRKLTVQKLQAYYELYKINSGKSHKILIDNGISEKDIRVFDALKRCNDDQAIPNVLVNGEEIGYPGVYLKKLDILSDQGAAIAATLGLMPKIKCCQHLGGAGADCAKHGISSPNGGFYVLCKGNAEEPNIEDDILAASWLWNSQSGAPCLDSVESKLYDKLDVITDMYRYFSHTLCRNEIPGQRHISHVNIGAQSGVSTKVAYKNYPAPREHFIDYAGYTDAKSQFILANSTMPYLFYGTVKSTMFQSIIEKQSKEFFQAIFQNPSPLKDSEPLKQAIAFALYGNNGNLLTLLAESAGARNQELQSLISVNRRYVEHLNQNKLDFPALRDGAYLNAMTKKGETALHIAALAGDEAVVRHLINSGINLDIQDENGNSALIRLLGDVLYKYKKQQGRLLAKILIEAGANIDIKDKDENTPLIIAVKNRDFEMVRYLVDDHKADIETFDGDMKTAIFWAAEKGYGDIFNYLLHKNAKINLLSYNAQDSLLMTAVRGGNQEIIKALLSRKGVNIEHQNKLGETLLHLAADHPESLKIILALYPEEQRLDAVKAADGNGKTVLHSAASNPESLKIILALYPEHQRLAAVKVALRNGETVLHWAASHPESLNAILSLIPKEQRLDAIKVAGNYGATLLHWAANNPESLRAILTHIPQEQRLDAIKVADKGGTTVLHAAADNPESVEIILAFYPEDQRQDAIKVADGNEKTVLHWAANNPESLKAILAFIPKEQRLDAIKVADKYGLTVLHHAANNPESMKIIHALTLNASIQHNEQPHPSPQQNPVSPDAFFKPAPSANTKQQANKVELPNISEDKGFNRN